MRSFAVWYDAEEHIDHDVEAKIHINFWNSVEYLQKEKDCFFDFGFLINDISGISAINLYCPFYVEKKGACGYNIYDLGAKISNIELIDAIFNENYTAVSGAPKRYLVNTKPYEVSGTAESNPSNFEKFVIYSLDENNEIDVKYCKKQPYQGDNAGNKCNDGTIITLKIKDIEKYSSEILDDTKAYYFRIRIRVREDALSTITQNVDYKFFLKANLYSTVVMDFRLNDIRSFNQEIKNKYTYGRKFKIISVNYLIMKNITDEVEALGMNMTCRLLESDLWNQYIDGLQNNMMAYHIKKKMNHDKPIQDFCAIVKVKYEKVTYKLLFWYVIGAAFIGVLGNIFYSKLCDGWDILCNFLQKILELM